MVFPVVGGDGKPTGYEIENSLRLTDNAYLNISRSSQSNTTGTFSAWIKTAAQNSFQLAGGHTDVNNRSYIYFPSSGDGFSGGIFSRTSGSADLNFSTSAVYRDPSAWYHLVVAIDTTQSTESNRVKWYVNGEQITSFSASSYPSQNASIPILNKATQTIGAGYGASAVSVWSDGYMAEVYYIDGTQYAASNFGETNDNGVWIPKDASGDLTFGTNGFYLEFKQTGTSQNSSGIGADTSGNDNHLAVNSLSATDVTVDTPTNNFCTLNPLSAGSDIRANGSFKEGNCELVNGDTTGQSNGQKCQGTMGFANGKWYWEVKLISNTMTAGIVDSAIQTSSDINLGSKNAVTYDSETGAINNINGAVQGETVSSQYDDDDIIGVAVDADNGAVYFSKNGTYQNSGNPTSGASKTGGATFTLGNQMLPLAADNSSGSAGNHQYNFGNAPFSISSGNADANGYGNFEYAPPSGYYSVCTKNLAEFG